MHVDLSGRVHGIDPQDVHGAGYIAPLHRVDDDSRSYGVISAWASAMPAVPTSRPRRPQLVRATCSRRMTSTPKPSSPRSTLPNPAMSVRRVMRSPRQRLDVRGHPDLVVLDARRAHRSARCRRRALNRFAHRTGSHARSIAARRPCARPEVQWQRLSPHRFVTAWSCPSTFTIRTGVPRHRPRSSGRAEPYGGARAPIHRPLGDEGPRLDQDRSGRRHARRSRAPESRANPARSASSRSWPRPPSRHRWAESVEPNVNDAADDLEELDVDAVTMEMATDHIERFLRHQPAIHGQQLVGHQQHADRGIGSQAIDEGLARHAADGVHEMGQGGAVHRIDVLEQRGTSVRGRRRHADSSGSMSCSISASRSGGSVRCRAPLGHSPVPSGIGRTGRVSAASRSVAMPPDQTQARSIAAPLRR